MVFESERWPLHNALAWVLTRDRAFTEKAKSSDFKPRLSDSDWKSSDHVDQAWAQLHSRLKAGEIPTFGDDNTRLHPKALEECQWSVLGSISTLICGGTPIANKIEISSNGLLHFFPPGSSPIAFGSDELGPPERPAGAGYMTFSNAVYWVASEGGKKRFWASEQQVWRRAVSLLVDAVASGSIRLIGRQRPTSLPESIPGHVLSGLQITVPCEELSFDLLMGEEPYLDVTLPTEGDDWLASNDTVRTGRDLKISHLQVPREDVRAHWPFDAKSNLLQSNTTPRRRASGSSIREGVKRLLAANPHAGVRQVDAMALELNADRDAAREELARERSRLKILVRKGRPRAR